MFARFCRLATTDGDLKKRDSWDIEEIRNEETGQVSLEEDNDSPKENGCVLQEVDLVANCPLPLVTPPRTPSPARSTSSSSLKSMGQRPSSLLRPKISLTWVLRGQQHTQHHQNTSEVNGNTNVDISVESLGKKSKERTSRRSVKSTKSIKSLKEKEPSEHIDRLDKHDKCNVLQEMDKIVRLEKVEKEELVTTTRQLDTLVSSQVNKNVIKESSDSDKVKRAVSEPSLVTRESSTTTAEVTTTTTITTTATITTTTATVTTNTREKHRHRRAKRSNKPRPPTRFGYEIADLDSFLTKASIERPANIPVVLSFPSVLYQTQGGIQDEIALPLGTVVNAVFKNQAWLYVQTPHGQEGYVGYAACLPLGIIPQPTCGPCWEDSTDVFPKPLGNMTDTEKLRDTRSECGARERNTRVRRGHRDAVSTCGERSVDRLYLRAAANARTKGSRQTLLVIQSDYEGRGKNSISVTKGDVVALLSDHVRGWFWVRSRDGREGFIPSVIAGHGFL